MLQASGNTPEALAADYPFVRLGDGLAYGLMRRPLGAQEAISGA